MPRIRALTNLRSQAQVEEITASEWKAAQAFDQLAEMSRQLSEAPGLIIQGYADAGHFGTVASTSSNLLIVCFTFSDFLCPKLQQLRPLPWLTRKSSRGLRSLQLPELILRTSVGTATDDTPDICHAMPEYITKI